MKLFTFLICIIVSSGCFASTQEDFELKYYKLMERYIQTQSDRNQIISTEAKTEQEDLVRSNKLKALDCKGWKENIELFDFILSRFKEYESASEEVRTMGYTKENLQEDSEWLREQLHKPENQCR
ncbi:hypothetical protein POD11_01480 [Acinetobacter sp. P1(2023)]|jgi:hypothetical protein|uniref:Lysozyme inhibitor LprI N-terminal domain-containing protein n=1 Tax=Acinetobacter pittii ANC 4050 TaxID=1217691 RepID=R8YI80_ACIPI|nr:MULTISPECIES: hypothetical protein [Acinetobacter]EOQ68954.1 hypothetical protein F931_01673 [Acinetobacter pittii ANC 4050]MCG9515097.1 hypothetical protein [Acinetobacter pittii]MCU4528843.1 hypothetical protein [Acinetobacter sp. WU_MDCI_Abxe169]MDC0840928.1 hypothetical protein [Acinetobacter sp. P1(2023)]MDX8237000.1 hypothetical protein [Acinetobacter pittii]